MFHLSLTENGLHHNLKNFFIDLEIGGGLRIVTIFVQQFVVTDEHLSKLRNLSLKIVWRDLVEFQTNFLGVILYLRGILHLLLSRSIHLFAKLVNLAPLFVVDWFSVPIVLVASGLLLRSEVSFTIVATATSATWTIVVASISISIAATVLPATSASTEAIASRPLGPLLVHKTLILAFVASVDDTRVHTHLHEIGRQVNDVVLKGADETSEHVNSDLFARLSTLDLVEALGELHHFWSVFFSDFVTLDILV